MVSNEYRVSVGVSIPGDLLDELDEHCDDDDIARSKFIQQAIRHYMNAEDNE